MFRKEITYTNFNGEKVTEPFYFNLTQAEVVELEVDYDGGLRATLQRIVESQDAKGLVREFKRLILASYGEKSDDGRYFRKNDQLREDFTQTAAYSKLFTELAEDANAAADFILGVFPKEMTEGVSREDLLEASTEGETGAPSPTPPAVPNPSQTS